MRRNRTGPDQRGERDGPEHSDCGPVAGDQHGSGSQTGKTTLYRITNLYTDWQINESGLKIFSIEDLQSAAEKSAQFSKVVKMARDIDVGVEFSLGI